MFTDITFLDIILRGLLLSALCLAWVIFCVRIIGLRAFSKMTAFDFVVTVATGSLLAGAAQASDWAGFTQPLIAIGGLLVVQLILAKARRASDGVENALNNDPVLLMRDGEILHAALDHTRVAQSDLTAKLREANVLHPSQVRAVILETTGDISVLHGDTLDDTLLDGVKTIT